MKNIKLSLRSLGGFAVVLLAVAAVSPVLARTFSHLRGEVNSMQTDSFPGLDLSAKVRPLVTEGYALTQLATLSSDSKELETYRRQIGEIAQTTSGALSEYERAMVGTDERQVFDGMKSTYETWSASRDRVVALVLSGKRDEAAQLFKAEARRAYQAFNERSSTFFTFNQEAAVRSARTIDQSVVALTSGLLLAFVAVLLLGGVITVMMVRSVPRVVSLLVDHVTRVGQGDLAARTDYVADDEVGTLVAAVNKMTEEVMAMKRAEAEASARDRAATDELQQRTDELQQKTVELQQATAEMRQKAEDLQQRADEVQQKNEEMQRQSEQMQQQNVDMQQKINTDQFAADELQRKIDSLLEIIGHVANGDLTHDVLVSGSDAVGQLGEGIARLIESLNKNMTSIAYSAQALASSSEQLSATAQQMATNSEETSAQANTVSAAAAQVSRNVQTVASGAEEMTISIKEIAKNAHEATRVATSAVRVAEETNATIIKLGDSSNDIGKVIKVITSIAEQTNLLALNATIEAARAGEAGKGFAVVANEVKELAKETAKATEDISRKVDAIQGDTSAAVKAIQQIRMIIAQVNDISTSIAGAVEEQTATTSEIGRNVGEAAKGATDIAHNITGVAQAAQATAAGATDSQTASGSLSQMATELQSIVSQFSLRQGDGVGLPGRRSTRNGLGKASSNGKANGTGRSLLRGA